MSNLVRDYFAKIIGEAKPPKDMTQDLMTLFESPESVQWFIEILNDDHQLMRQYAVVNFRHVIERNWAKIEEDGAAPSFLQQFINYLQNETSPRNVQNFMHSIRDVLGRYGDNWPELFQLAFSLVNERPTIALHILVESFEFVQIDFARQSAENILQLINFIVSNGIETEFSNLAAQLYFVLVNREEPLFQPYPEDFIQTFMILVNQYINDLKNAAISPADSERIASHQASAIGQILSISFPICDLGQIYVNFLNLVMDETVLRHLVYTIFEPLTEIINSNPDLVRQYFPDTLNVIFTHLASIFDPEESYEYQPTFQIDVIVAIAANMNSSALIDILLQYIQSSETSHQDYAWLNIFYESLPNIVGEVETRSEQLMPCLLNVLQKTDEPTGQLVLLTLEKMCDVCPDLVANYCDDIIRCIEPYYGGNDETFKILVDFLSFMFMAAPVDTIDVNNSVTHIFEVSAAEHNDVQSYTLMYNMLNSAVQHCMGESIVFVPNRIQDIIETLASDDEMLVSLKGPAIECLSSIIATCYTDEELGETECEHIGFYIEKLTALIMNVDDLDTIVYSMRSIRYLLSHNKAVLSRVEGLDPMVFVATLMMSLLPAFDAVYVNYIQSDSDQNNEMIERYFWAMGNIINAMKTVLHHFNDEIQQLISGEQNQFHMIITALATQFIQHSAAEDELVSYLLNLGYRLLYLPPTMDEGGHPTDPETFYKKYMHVLLSTIVESENVDNVISSLRNAKKLIKNRYQFIGQDVPTIYEYVIKLLNRELPIFSNCDDLFKYDPDLVPESHEVLVNIFLYYYESINVEAFYNYIREAQGKMSDGEKAEIFSPLSSAVVTCDVPPELIEFGLQALALCDFNHSPDPIFFFNQLVTEKKELVCSIPDFERIIVQLKDLLVSILSQEVCKLRYFWETVANAAILLIILSQQFPGLLNLAEVFPVIVNKVPYKKDYIEAKNIMLELLKFGVNELIMQNVMEVFRGYVTTIALPEKQLLNYDFTPEELQKIIEITKTLMQNHAELSNLIPTILNENEIRVQIFSQRMGLN